MDRDSFKSFCDNLRSQVEGYHKICITSYFSETIRETLQKLISPSNNVRLICPEFPVKFPRDKKNLQTLKKLAGARAEIMFNNRLHARFLVAYNPAIGGLLILGSFDFNAECIGKERHDAGIKTRHSDLVESAIALFEQIWKEPESISLEDFVKKVKS